MKNRRKKGSMDIGHTEKKYRFWKSYIGVAMILFQLGARYVTDNQAAKNILTVMAILSVLPMANVASPLLAAWKYRTPPEEFYHQVQKYESACCILYDLILTSKEAIMPVDAAAVHPQGVYLYCSSAKTDCKKGEKFLNELFAAHRLDPKVKLIQDKKAFFNRLECLKPATEYEDDGSVEYTRELLKQISM